LKELLITKPISESISGENNVKSHRWKFGAYISVVLVSFLVSFFAEKLPLHFLFVFFGLFTLFGIGVWFMNRGSMVIGKRTRATIIVGIFALSGYFVSALTWVYNEFECTNKTYGVFKYIEGDTLITSQNVLKGIYIQPDSNKKK
jgi:hypothetical protein